MRLTILVLGILLVFVTLNYILKCLEYKDLQSVNEVYSRLYSKSKAYAYDLEKQVALLRSNLHTCEVDKDYYKRIAAESIKREDDTTRVKDFLQHKIYLLRKDIKRKDRAIVRYKNQNEVFKHGYHEIEERNNKLRRMYTTEIQTEQWLRSMWYATMDERDAYLYCLRQIQEEVENAKKE